MLTKNRSTVRRSIDSIDDVHDVAGRDEPEVFTYIIKTDDPSFRPASKGDLDEVLKDGRQGGRYADEKSLVTDSEVLTPQRGLPSSSKRRIYHGVAAALCSGFLGGICSMHISDAPTIALFYFILMIPALGTTFAAFDSALQGDRYDEQE